MRNIANVVHDLRPIVMYLKEKPVAVRATDDLEEIMELLSKLEYDGVMLELYLDALDNDAKSAGLSRQNQD
jgi:hypothetical protein